MRRGFAMVWLGLAAAMMGGCGGGSTSSGPSRPSFPGVSVPLAAVGDPAVLQPIRSWRGAWEQAVGGQVAVEPEPVGPKNLRGADVLVFPGDRLGDLVRSEALLVLRDSDIRTPMPLGPREAPPPDPLALAEIVPSEREEVSQWGDDRMGLPIGGSALVLAYRRDAFDSETNRKAAAATGLELKPPETWEQLDALARFFAGRDWDGSGRARGGIAAPLGDDPEGIADTLVLARAAALGAHPDHYDFLFDSGTMEPKIATPPFVEALAGVASWSKLAPPGGSPRTAQDARKAFRSGEAALLIDRAEAVRQWADAKHPVPIGVARLPGSPRVYDPRGRKWDTPATPNRPSYLPRGGGWLVGVSARVPKDRRAAALDLAKTLAGPEASRAIQADPAFPMLPVRSSALGVGLPFGGASLGIDSRAWGVAVAETLTNARVIPGLRIPGADAYLAEFARARGAAIAGTPPEAALLAASAAWAELSKKLGPRTQLWHYRRSLNRLITESTPPESEE